MNSATISRILPGILLAAIIGVISSGVAIVETRAFGHPIIEALVVAILLGMIVRTAWTPAPQFTAGVRFSAKEVLEFAVLLLGASVDLPLLLKAGPALAVGIVLLVIIGLSVSYTIGRVCGLPTKLAILVACGNSICGNSAIAAVAPVIDADAEHIASSIAFTAILGVIVVLTLPLLVHPLGLSFYQYGVLAGLTVYAVPQVLAAFPVSVLSGQVGTLVKLVRVLLLGPVVLFFAIRYRRPVVAGEKKSGFALNRFVPWFIIGFLALAALRSGGFIPAAWVAPTRTVSGWLTILAMAALGLGVDLRAMRRVGAGVVVTVTASLLMLIGLSLTLIHVLKIA